MAFAVFFYSFADRKWEGPKAVRHYATIFPPDFLDSPKMEADTDAKLSLPHLSSNFREIGLETFWENGPLVALCFAILGKKRWMFEDF